MEENEENLDVIILFYFCGCSLDGTAEVLWIHLGYHSPLNSGKMCELKDSMFHLSLSLLETIRLYH